MKEYKLGDAPWMASFNYTEQKITCPACFGKLQLKVVLGNDEEVIVPCNSCDRGYEGSVGFITESNWASDVKQIIISRVSVIETLESDRKVDAYFFNENNYVSPSDNKLFDTKEEAEKRVLELIDQHELEKKDSIKRKKQEPTKTYGWHVRYHSREIKELERRLEYHRKKLIIVKPLAKEDKIKP